MSPHDPTPRPGEVLLPRPGAVSDPLPRTSRRPSRAGLVQLLRFAVIGVGSTVLHLGLFALMNPHLGTQLANLVALVIATVLNTAANRAWTFGVRGRAGWARHQGQALLVFAITWGATSAALALLAVASSQPSATASVVTVGVANVVSTALRFVAMRAWIFRPTAAAAG